MDIENPYKIPEKNYTAKRVADVIKSLEMVLEQAYKQEALRHDGTFWAACWGNLQDLAESCREVVATPNARRKRMEQDIGAANGTKNN